MLLFTEVQILDADELKLNMMRKLDNKSESNIQNKDLFMNQRVNTVRVCLVYFLFSMLTVLFCYLQMIQWAHEKVVIIFLQG